jgi:hypothetical protein
LITALITGLPADPMPGRLSCREAAGAEAADEAALVAPAVLAPRRRPILGVAGRLRPVNAVEALARLTPRHRRLRAVVPEAAPPQTLGRQAAEGVGDRGKPARGSMATPSWA